MFTGDVVMRKSILIIMLLFFLALAFPATGDAAYLIRLKNGGEFKTFKYWSEGGQIKFYIYGGIVGVQKDSVQRIKKVALVHKERVVSPPKKPAPVPVKTELETDAKVKDAPNTDAKEEESPAVGTAGNETKSKEIDVAYYKREKRALMEKYREAREKLKQAREDHDIIAKKDAKKEVRKLDNQISELAIKLKKENNGILPAWWYMESKPE